MRVRFTLIIFAVLLIGLLIPVMADSDLPDNNAASLQSVQKIAFSSKRNGNFDIYTINDDGTDLKRLTNNKNDDIKPQWSPDMSKILYLSKNGKKYSIFIMNSDGSNQIKLINDCSNEFLPTWSPDGTKILFTAQDKGKTAIFTVNADGSNTIRLTESNTDGAFPSWSPDGSKVLFRQRRGDNIYLYTIKPDGTERFRLTDPGRYVDLAWASSGNKIAYIGISRKLYGGSNMIYTINIDGTNNFEVIQGSKKIEDIDYYDQLTWSPDGKTLAYNKVADAEVDMSEKGSLTCTYTYGVYIVSLGGESSEELLERTGEVRVMPSWAPDSSKLAYLNNSRLKVLNMKSKITDEIRVDVSIPLSRVLWSPDGKKLIFVGKNNSFQKSGLYLVTLDGKVTKISDENDYDPVWAPVQK